MATRKFDAKTIRDTLPDSLSGLLAVGLDSLSECEKSKLYRVSMGRWHSPYKGEGVCGVSLAGAVMAIRLGAPSTESLTPDSFGETVARKLRALDWIVDSKIEEALMSIEEKYRPGYVIGSRKFARRIPRYFQDSNLFTTSLNLLVADLRAKGL